MSEKVLLTRAGYERMQSDLRRLKSEDRRRVAEEIRLAAEHGDLSENAEYEAAKERQSHVEGRIRVLEDKLARAEVVELRGQIADRIRFGATVVLEDLGSGDRVTYTLVGEDEADVSRGYLSVTSPVGRALIGKRVDEEVLVRVPAGTKEYEVRDIRFDE